MLKEGVVGRSVGTYVAPGDGDACAFAKASARNDIHKPFAAVRLVGDAAI